MPEPAWDEGASGDEAGPDAEWISTSSEGEAPAELGEEPPAQPAEEGQEEAAAEGSAGPQEGWPEAGEQLAGDEWGVNLAFGCPAEASSAASEDCHAACAVDGSPDTRWTSEPEDEQWIYVDLGAERAILRVDVRWESACCETYTVNGSLDLEDWAPLAEEPGREGWVSTALPPDTWARWVSIYCSRRTTERGFGICELGVYETALPGAADQAELAAEAMPDETAHGAEAFAADDCGPAEEAPAQEAPLGKIPAEVAEELKWFILYQVRRKLHGALAAATEEGTRKEWLLQQARKDLESAGFLQQAVKNTGALHDPTVARIEKQADRVGLAAAAGAQEGRWLPAAITEALEAPEQLQEDLWAQLVHAIRSAGVAAVFVFHDAKKATPHRDDFEMRWEAVTPKRHKPWTY